MSSPDTTAGGGDIDEAGDLDQFVTAVLAASWVLVGISNRTLEEVDERVTLTQFRTLAVLGDRGQTNLSRLAEELDVNASTAMRVVDRLVAIDMVSRVENPASRREVVLSLTETGARLVADVVAKRRDEIGALIGSIPRAEQVALVAALGAFTGAAEAAGSRAAARAALGW